MSDEAKTSEFLPAVPPITGDGLSLHDVLYRADELRAAGVFEQTLLSAYRQPEGAVVHLDTIRDLFRAADRAKLRAAGDPLLGRGPFVLDRGGAGRRLPGTGLELDAISRHRKVLRAPSPEWDLRRARQVGAGGRTARGVSHHNL